MLQPYFYPFHFPEQIISFSYGNFQFQNKLVPINMASMFIGMELGYLCAVESRCGLDSVLLFERVLGGRGGIYEITGAVMGGSG